MTKKFTDITLKGSQYSFANLVELSNAKIQSKTTTAWEISLYKFILDWISDSPGIEVKTSGSTGEPKIIYIEKGKMIQSALRTGKFFHLKKNDKTILCLPVDFIAGKMMVVRAFVLGLNLIPVEPKGNPLELLNEGFHFAAMTPMQVTNILKRDKGRKKLNRIRNLIIGGGEISSQLYENISTLTNNAWHTYGMTETITHVALKKLNGTNSTNYFEALPGVTFEKDERGCLVIRASYLSDIPFVTNDMVKLASETKFEFIGRYDNVINTGGVKVFPEKIEKKLEPYFDNRIVISGIPDEIMGDKVVLVIEGSYVYGQNFNTVCTEANLLKFEVPKEGFYLNKFPETVGGKIDRNKVIEMITKNR